MTSAPLLSIIVPFYNSLEKCEPLLRILAKIQSDDGVELILVDDGSTDQTLTRLREFAKTAFVNPCIIERENGGPGAARNSGLEKATGKWVWFVDSDDRIDLDVLAFARTTDWPEAEMVIWDWHHPMPRDRLAYGVHEHISSPLPCDVIDPIVGNWFSLEFLRRTRLRFPEYCTYEATPIEAFVLPLLVSSFVRVRHAPYLSDATNRSVTRTEPDDPRLYDRLATAALGMAFASETRLEPSDRARFETAFIRSFLWYSIDLSKIPGPSWLRAARVMRKFRDEARRFQIDSDQWSLYPGRWHSKVAAWALWLISAGLPSQDRHFDRLHMRAWGRPIEWKRPLQQAEQSVAAAGVTQRLPDEAGAKNSLPEPARS